MTVESQQGLFTAIKFNSKAITIGIPSKYEQFWNLGPLYTFRHVTVIAKSFNCPSISHKDEHLEKTHKNQMKIQKIQILKFSLFGFFFVVNCNSYLLMLCIFLRGILLTNSLKLPYQKQIINKCSSYKNRKHHSFLAPWDIYLETGKDIIP